jgi:hypothetical protein
VSQSVKARLGDQHEKLTQAAIDLALGGDPTALRLCFERMAPLQKEEPVEFELPPVRSAADLAEASGAVLAAMADGEITPAEAERVMAVLATYKKHVDRADINDFFKEHSQEFLDAWVDKYMSTGSIEGLPVLPLD